jgi:hypothetical protein
MRTAAALGVALLMGPSVLAGQSAEAALQGAWRVAQVVRSGAGAGVNDSPQPGLLLFAGRHYSYTLLTGDEPRPDLPNRLPTAEELLMVWNPFSANAGTFEVSGDTMTRRPIVSKGPAAMAPGAFNEYTFRLSADTLWITPARTEAGPARNPVTVRYTRVH